MNNTTENTTIKPFELFSTSQKIIGFSFGYGILSVMALTGNIMVLLVVFINRGMHTAINLLLVNLSVSDILFVLVSVPGFLALEICNDRWVLGVGMAVATQLTAFLSSAASVFTLMAIAFERYFAVLHPLKHRTRNKKITMILTLIVIWICALACALPFGISTTLKTFTLLVKKDGGLVLEEIHFLDLKMDVKVFKVYFTVIFVVLHVIPFSLLSLLYAHIAWRLWHPDKQLTQRSEGGNANQVQWRNVQRTRRKTTAMVIAVLIAFFVCYFPFHIVFLTELYKTEDELKPPDDTSSILRLLLLLNGAINPIIYNLLSENFRAGFRNLLSSACCPCGQTEENTVSVDTLNNVGTI